MPDSSQPSDQTPSQSAVPASAPAANAAAAPAAAPASASAKPAEGKPAAAAGATVPATADGQPAAAAAAPGPAAGKPAANAAPPAAAPADGQATGADGQPAAAAPDAAQAAAVVPESYVLPQIEGIEYNPAALAGMSPAFKEAKLTQGQVDGLVKGFLEYQKGLPQAMLAADLEVTMKDPQLGGMNWGRTQGYVTDALTAFTTPQFRKQLEGWGIANNPEFVRVFERIGRAMRGDEIPGGQPTSAETESRADRIYGRKKG